MSAELDNFEKVRCSECGVAAQVSTTLTVLDDPFGACKLDQGMACPHLRDAVSAAHATLRRPATGS